jgi:prolyl 4-hydroxylase
VDELFAGDGDELADLQHDLIPSFTAEGFRVVSTPADVQGRLGRAFTSGWAAARPEGGDPNIMPSGDPTFVDLDDLGGVILGELQGLHEDWCGAPLEPTAAFGLRAYGEGQTLARHVDRFETHVISSVVHVAADVDEPWPLVVEDRSGERHEVVLEPGQMLLYEGAKLPHSRPAPLQGRHYTSLFLHYRPVDWPRTLDRVCREAADASRGRQQ